jgi:hypothetical protein
LQRKNAPDGPNRIKSLQELDPCFVPRWLRLQVWVVAVFAAAFVAVLLIGWLLGVSGTPFFLLGIVMTGLAVSAVIEGGPTLLLLAGRYLPRLTLWAINLDKWLQRDLDWPRDWPAFWLVGGK